MKISRRFSLLAATALSLSACSGGGGGGGGTASSSLPAPSSVSTPTSPTSTPLLSTLQTLINLGTAQTWTYPAYNQYVPTTVVTAIQEGATGAGVSIGILDTGANTGVQALQGRVAWFNSYLAQGNNTLNQNNIASANDPYGHGSIVTALLGGATQGTYDNTQGPVNFFAGGVAPDATLYVAQTCDATGACTLYGKTYQDLMANGVHLFNQSLAENASSFSTASAAIQASQQIGALFAPFGTGNLYVWAAGNNPQSPNDISVEAEAPAYTNSLQPQWISAVNVDINSLGQVSGLDPTSNACGITAQWCIAAPGYDQVPIVAGTSFNTGFAVGTSFSAPIITGVAALIWQKFPWFTPANVSDTLLTTATPLGSAPAPNTTYGWGLVNAAAAINGPAQFAFGTFTANIGSDQGTFSNNIGGSGGLVVDGTTGTLTLTGNDGYAGGTTINGGSLALTGSLGSAVTINGGSFGGSGTVNGSVTNAGGTLVSQAAAGGSGLTINGNYATGSGSSTAIAIGNPLTVSGKAQLNGTFKVLAPPQTYLPQSIETFIRAGSIQGAFSNQTYGAGVYYTVSNLQYGAQDLTATVTRSNVAQVAAAMPGATPVAVAAASGVQGALQQINTWSAGEAAANPTFLNAVAAVLSARTAQQAQASLTSLSGEIYPTLRTITIDEDMSISRAIAGHAAEHQAGPTTSVWVRYLGTFGSFRETGTDAAHYNDNGVVVGLDTPIAPDFTAGVAFAHDQANASLNGFGGRFHSDLDTATAYARLGGAAGPYLTGQVSYGWMNGRVDRSVLLGYQTAPVSSEPTGTIGGLAAEAGYRIGAWTPYVRLGAVHLYEHAVSETGGLGFGLAMPAVDQTDGYVTTGLRGRTVLDLFGHAILASGRLAWQHRLGGSSNSQGAFEATPAATFNLSGQNLPVNVLRAGFQLSGRLDRAWSWNAGVSVNYAPSGMNAEAVNVGLKARF